MPNPNTIQSLLSELLFLIQIQTLSVLKIWAFMNRVSGRNHLFQNSYSVIVYFMICTTYLTIQCIFIVYGLIKMIYGDSDFNRCTKESNCIFILFNGFYHFNLLYVESFYVKSSFESLHQSYNFSSFDAIMTPASRFRRLIYHCSRM